MAIVSEEKKASQFMVLNWIKVFQETPLRSVCPKSLIAQTPVFKESRVTMLRSMCWIFISFLISAPSFAGGFILQIIDQCSDAQIGECSPVDQAFYEKNIEEMTEKTSSGIPFKRQSLRCGPGSHLSLYLFSSREACEIYAKSYQLDFGVKESSNYGPSFKIEDVYQAKDIVWGLCFLSPHEILFTQKNGVLSHLDLKTKKATNVSGLPDIHPRGQGGLMDVQTHPEFKKNSLIYFSYATKNKENSWTTRIARARLKDFKLQNLEVLFTADIDSNQGEHFGSRIVFDGKGHIFFGIGDRGQRDLAQSLEHHNGKIIRLNEDGSIPKDNPFLSNKKARPEIWSYGHRNPQGMARHFQTGEIWSNEHGPRGGDEINLILPGKNYGWPVVTFGREYWGPKIGEGTEKPGIENPFYQFTPSIAPSALMIYSGKLFPEWAGHFFSSALVMQHLNRVAVENQKAIHEEKMLRDLNERIRNVVESPDGQIFLSTDSGRIIRLLKSSQSDQ